ncbi:MAG: alcohol dehydrogenase catalytic domain-containing protein [Actinobacteria bacterium]|nr:alcohol dehydrogenase catalytic domain-containing protein [Actinomycetota bacterium]
MKAVVIKGINRLSVDDVEVKKPQGDEVLIKVDIAGLCGTDVHMWAGTNFEGTYPFVPGHEWIGHIVETGPDVKTLKLGDRVTGDNFIACRKCDVCKSGGAPHFCLNHDAYGYTPDFPGAMAEYHWSPEERLYKIPDNISDEEGVLTEVVSVPYHAIWARSGGIGPHDRVAIIGTGPVGLLAIQISLITGAKVIVIEPEPNRAKLAEQLGAKFIINPSIGNPAKEVINLTKGLGVTRIIECSGSTGGIALTVDIISVDGIIVLTGQSIGTKVPIEIGKIIWKHAKIVGSCGAPYFFPNTIDFLSKHLIDATMVVTNRFSINEAQLAFDMGLKATSGKILIYSDVSKMPK